MANILYALGMNDELQKKFEYVRSHLQNKFGKQSISSTFRILIIQTYDSLIEKNGEKTTHNS